MPKPLRGVWHPTPTFASALSVRPFNTPFALWQGRYCGLGTNLISAALQNGATIYLIDQHPSSPFVTLAAGYYSGEVTPLFSIGASLGWPYLDLSASIPLCAVLGYAATFGGATRCSHLSSVARSLDLATFRRSLSSALSHYLFNMDKSIYTL